MPPERLERRLAAILAVDMVGYSRLMEADERRTIERQRAHHSELIDPKITEHHGRVVHTAGDGLLVEFASAVDAVECAVALQRGMAQREAGNAEEDRIAYRIGINIGDIVVENGDICGDGVNVAARLEGLASSGEIYVTRNVVNQVKNKLDLGFEEMGEHRLKNISEPVLVYRIVQKGKLPGVQTVASAEQKKTIKSAALGAAILAVVGVALWATYGFVGRDGAFSVKPPKVAVLPFRNISGDPEQQFFAYGLSEDLITDLSKIAGLPVISSTSSFSYLGAKTSLRQIAEKLNARYIVEGSVRRHGNALRISAKLVDAQSDSQLWAERFDGSGGDVFAFQDRITAEIVSALRVTLTPSERKSITSKGTKDAAAYDLFLRGMRLLSSRRALDVDSNSAAVTAFEEAIRIDPNYAQAHAGLGWAHWLYYSTINTFAIRRMDAAVANAKKSQKLRKTALAHRILSRQYYWPYPSAINLWRPKLALEELRAAQKLEPNNPDIMAELADVLPFAGHLKEALAQIRNAIDLNPDHPDWYFRPYGISLFLDGKFEKSAQYLESWLQNERRTKIYNIWRAAALALAGHQDQAKELVAQGWFGEGPRTLYAVRRYWQLPREYEEILFRGLREAGLPDGPLKSR